MKLYFYACKKFVLILAHINVFFWLIIEIKDFVFSSQVYRLKWLFYSSVNNSSV